MYVGEHNIKVYLGGKKLSSCEEDFIGVDSLTCKSEICGKIFVATLVKLGFHQKKNFLMDYIPFGSINYQ
jgi:hypothetical protein